MKTRIHVVSYTHWDREFRWEFEQTRMKLVDCIDRLLEIMEGNPAYKSFLMDGQVGMLDDYLEIRPENRTRLDTLVKAGRLELGPWFTLPDAATVNGESVIRNILHGTRVSRNYGHLLKCGYSVFSFGQIAHLPQIYKAFGIDTIIFYKSMHPSRSPSPEFLWEAPDGSTCYASRLGREGRWNFFFAGHIPMVYGLDPWDKAWRYEYGTMGKVFHPAHPEDYGWFHEILDPESSWHKEKLEDGMKRSLETVEGTLAPKSLLFFDGTDFTEPHPKIPEIIAALQTKFGDRYEVVHGSLGAYLAELKGHLEKHKNLPRVTGAMRDGPVASVHSDVMTIHPELKQMNGALENRILRAVEPLASFAWALGIARYPTTYLNKTWKLLFQTHPHDSIHGLGPRGVAQGGVARLEQAGNIAVGLERRAMSDISKEIKTADVKDASTFLTVYNTCSFARSEAVETWVDIPADVALDKVIVEDPDGKACLSQELSRAETRAGVYHPRSRNMPFYSTRVHLLFLAENVPALGYKAYKIKWTAKKDYPYPHEDWFPPTILPTDLLVAPNRARNEYVELTVNGDGTLRVTDLKTGYAADGLNRILDSGDCGNMWMSNSPEVDRIISSAGVPASVSCSLHGPLIAVFSVHSELKVPTAFDFLNRRRCDSVAGIPVRTEVTLRKGRPYVEVRTVVENTARDHYLKVCFPTGFKAESTCADGSFCVTEYPTRPDLTRELARHPAQLWFDAFDGRQGLAVLCRSTHDYEILPEQSGDTMAMGLFRSMRLRIPCDNRLWMEYPGDESPQSLGRSLHEYAIMPHSGTWRKAGLYENALAFNQPMKSCQFGRQKGDLPMKWSGIAIDGAGVVLSAVKKAEDRDSVLVRLFNPGTETVRAKLAVGFALAGAYMSGMAEERGKKLKIENGRVALSVEKGKIMTVELDKGNA